MIWIFYPYVDSLLRNAINDQALDRIYPPQVNIEIVSVVVIVYNIDLYASKSNGSLLYGFCSWPIVNVFFSQC